MGNQEQPLQQISANNDKNNGAKDTGQSSEGGPAASIVYTSGRRVVLAGLGIVFFSVDQVQNLFGRATERGQVIENDVQAMLDRASERSTKAISSTLASVLNHLPVVRVTYMPLADQPQQQDNASAPPSVAPE